MTLRTATRDGATAAAASMGRSEGAAQGGQAGPVENLARSTPLAARPPLPCALENEVCGYARASDSRHASGFGWREGRDGGPEERCCPSTNQTFVASAAIEMVTDPKFDEREIGRKHVRK